MSRPEAGAVGYVRVSTDKQTDGHSLTHQRRVIERWCADRGIRLLAIYDNRGRGESGKDLQRDGLEQVDAHIRRGGVSHVVITKIDRLTRSLADISRLLAHWDEAGVSVLAPEDGITDPSLSGRMLPLLFAWMAEQERHRILSRMKPGMIARFESGLPHGRVPFGYQIVDGPPVVGRPARAARILVPQPEQAVVVRALFETAAQRDLGAQALSRWVSGQFPGIRMQPKSIARLLANPIYTGVLSAVFCDESGPRPRVLPDNHEALVSAELFAAVQHQRERRARELAEGHRLTSDASWLGGIACCHRCGERVTTRRLPSGEVVYQCRSRSTGAGCGAGRVPMETVDAMVLDSMYQGLAHMGRPLVTLAQDAVQEIPRHLDRSRGMADLALRNAAHRQAQLDEQLESGAINLDVYNAGVQALEERTALARSQLEEVDGLTYLSRLIHLNEPEAFAATGSSKRWMPFPLAIAALSLPERRRLVAQAAERITVLQEDFPFSECQWQRSARAFAVMTDGLSRMWGRTGGYALPADLPLARSRA
ncbi:MAG: recombinase family protein [Planctomycetota bacterium]